MPYYKPEIDRSPADPRSDFDRTRQGPEIEPRLQIIEIGTPVKPAYRPTYTPPYADDPTPARKPTVH